jgi:hypothetical protein
VKTTIAPWPRKPATEAPRVEISVVEKSPDGSRIRPGDLFVLARSHGSSLITQYTIVPSRQITDLFPSVESDAPFYVSYLQVNPAVARHRHFRLRELLQVPLYLSTAEDGERRNLTAPKKPESCGILDVETGGNDPLMRVYRNEFRRLALVREVDQYRLLVGICSAAAAVAPDVWD